MKILKTLSWLACILLSLTACHPRIYQFNVSPKTIGVNDVVKVNWKVKGTATLTIRDINYPGSGAARLADVTLLITRHGQINNYTLHADSTIKIPLAAEDSLVLRKKTDNIIDDRLRYITLVVSCHGQDSSRIVQVAVRPDSAADAIAFAPVLKGDSLVAAGINNPARWGDSVRVISVADPGSRPLDVVHSGIVRPLRPGAAPDAGFKGTPVKGNWVFRCLATSQEKSDPALIPHFIKLNITIKLN